MEKYVFISIVYIVLYSCDGKPATVSEGPCVGPDCYHGQLMHGDQEPGIDHKAEDTYLRIKDELAAGQGKSKPDTPEQLGVGKMEVEIGTQAKEEIKRGKILPVDAEAMMHGGDPQAHEHKTNPEHEAKPDENTDNVKRGPIMPIDAEGLMHGGDGRAHEHEAKPDENTDNVKRGPIMPIDAEGLMHGGDGRAHEHEAKPGENTDNVKRGPIMPIDAEGLMHGGDGTAHEHEAKTAGSADSIKRGPIMPIDAEALMHGGDGEAHEHGKVVEKEEERKNLGPGGEQYWHGALNHGDKELGVEHHKHDKEKQINKYDFDADDIKTIAGVGQILAKLDLEAMLKKNSEEYAKWMNDGAPDVRDENSLWNQIDQVRQRYLSFGNLGQEEDEEKRAKRLNPMTSEWEKDLSDGRASQKDDIVNGLEMFGNIGPVKTNKGNYRANRPNEDHVTHDES
ncbi:uncharacterized protein LOC126823757 [Patella vulgata]|uniref:uncharacterized protein LOC126823757 n=1 Tax=Patella vulgata TaxID=6465 RepID=UPI0021804F4E|nr:uncharacterized protein LOC126823757 [Patella vulgata]